MIDDRAPGAPDELEVALREAAAAGRWHDVASQAIAAYGDGLLGFLVALTRDVGLADDAFSLTLESIWRGLPTFAWRSSFRTWAYTIARNAAYRVARSRSRRRSQPLDPAIEAVAAPIRTRTATFLRTEQKDRLAAVRAELSPDDQSLLILRLGRNLAWREIAEVIPIDGAASVAASVTAPEPEPDNDDNDDLPPIVALSEADLDRRAATLRKRFMRLKDELRARLASAG